MLSENEVCAGGGGLLGKGPVCAFHELFHGTQPRKFTLTVTEAVTPDQLIGGHSVHVIRIGSDPSDDDEKFPAKVLPFPCRLVGRQVSGYCMPIYMTVDGG